MAYAAAASFGIIALLLLIRAFMGESSGRVHGVSHGGNLSYVDDAGIWEYKDDGKGGRRRTRRRQSSRPRRPMTKAERALASEGTQKLNEGRRIFDAAGTPGTPGEQAKLAEARGILRMAQTKFEQIEGMPSLGLEAAMEECNRLIVQCNRRTILHLGR